MDALSNEQIKYFADKCEENFLRKSYSIKFFGKKIQRIYK